MGFAFDFLLRAEDSPELSFLMLSGAMLALGIVLFLGGACLVFVAAQDLRETPERGMILAWALRIVGVVFLVTVLVMGWLAFAVTLDRFGDALALYSDMLLDRICAAEGRGGICTDRGPDGWSAGKARGRGKLC